METMQSHLRPLRLATALITGLALTAGVLGSAAPASATAVQVAPASSSPRFGVGTPGGPTDNSELDAVANTVGERPSIVLSYADFQQAPPIAALDSVAARGADSLLTWEPWKAGAGVNQPAFTNASIAAGEHDAYIAEWGAALAKWGGPVYLRYAHEMNGNWYPWAEGVNGNASGSYVAAWRHVHDVVAAQGATNVKWVWTPNVPASKFTPISSLYPGDGYVDVAGLDGYNWGTGSGGSWVSPSSLFDDGLTQLRRVASGKPILIAETASSETGGSKAQWNRDLVTYLASQRDVIGFVWFDFAKEQDWRIDSSSASAAALRDALAQRRD